MSGRFVARSGMVAAVAATGLLLTGCSGTHDSAGGDVATGAVRPAGADVGTVATVHPDRLVWVSGRDDHGMVAKESVAVYAGAGGGAAVGRVPDGTLARVLATDGQWLRIRTAGHHRVTGWIDDFFLRGEVRMVGTSRGCAVELAGRRREGGTLVVVRGLHGNRARVEMVADPSVSGWVASRDLQELPPQGPHCGDVPPDDRHAHEH